MSYSKILKKDINKSILESLCHKYLSIGSGDDCLVLIGDNQSLYVGSASSLKQEDELKGHDFTVNQFVVQYNGGWTVSKVVSAELLYPVLKMFQNAELEISDTHMLIQASEQGAESEVVLTTPPKSKNRLSNFALLSALMAVSSTFIMHNDLASPKSESLGVSEYIQAVSDFNNSIAELERLQALEAITISVNPENY